MYFQNQSSGYFIFRTDSGAERAYINRSGDLYLGYLGWLSNYINQNVRSGASPTFTEVYANGWFRNNNSGQGLYNQNRNMHWYSNNGYWKSAGGGYGYGGIQMYNNYESDTRGYAGYWDGSGFGMLNETGNWQIRIERGNAHMELYRITYGNDFRPYITYDRNDTGYYSDPNGTSNFARFTNRTHAAMNRGHHWITPRFDYTGDTNYWTGTFGWGTSAGNWANAWRAGFAGWDIWGGGTDHPQGGGYVHAQGIVSGLHYATSDGGAAYGWMMVGAGDATPNRYWLRGKWGGGVSGWREMLTSGNYSSWAIARGGDTVDGRIYFLYNRAYYGTQTDSSTLQAYTTGNNGAFMSYHKGGYYAINDGLDGDNVFRLGGWSSRWPRYYADADGATTFGVPYIMRSNFDNYGSGGLWVSDDGDLVDLNDGYLALRSSYGLRIHTGNRGGGPAIALRWDGQIIASSNIIAYGSPSDRRLKDNITPLSSESALDMVMKMRGVKFNWIEGSHEYQMVGLREDIGFIAQEVEDVEPLLVRAGQDGFLAVRDRAIPSILLEAIKEQQKQIMEQQKQMEALKAEIEILKSKI
jgi:hypothetical protein